MISWIVLILPYHGRTVARRPIRSELNILQQAGNPQARLPATISCPSDGSAGRVFQHPELTNNLVFAKANLAGFSSPYHVDLQLEFSGAFGGGGLKTSEVLDGMSKTMLLSEVRTRAQPLDQRGAWACRGTVRRNCRWMYIMIIHRHRERTCLGIDCWIRHRHPIISVGTSTCCTIVRTEPERFWMGCLVVWRRSMRTRVGTEPGCPPHPRSAHPGGVNLCSLDGHVTFLTDNVDPTRWPSVFVSMINGPS